MSGNEEILALNLDKIILHGWIWPREALIRSTLEVLQDAEAIYDLDGNELLLQEAYADCGEEYIPNTLPICRIVDDHPTHLTIISERDAELLIVELAEAVFNGIEVDWLPAGRNDKGEWTILDK